MPRWRGGRWRSPRRSRRGPRGDSNEFGILEVYPCILAPSRLTKGRRPVDIPEAEPRSGSCGRDLSPRSRATSGLPVGRALGPVDRPVRRQEHGRGERREASALRHWARNASPGVPACRLMARQGAAIRTSASRRFTPSCAHGAPEGTDEMQSRVDPVACDRRNGEALLRWTSRSDDLSIGLFDK
jgi:hypothetical protein